MGCLHWDRDRCATTVPPDNQKGTPAVFSIWQNLLTVFKHLKDLPNRKPVSSHLVFIIVIEEEARDIGG